MVWTKRDSDLKKIVGGFLNMDTIHNIWSLERKGYFDDVIGVEREGKESVIIRVEKGKDHRILKVHRIEAHKFNKIHQYIVGDPRFAGIKMERRSLVFTWTKKEFSNLKRAFEAKVKVPEPFGFSDNLLVMSIIQEKNGHVSPKLKDAEIKNPEKLCQTILKEYRKLYQDAKLVHADLSEFNILLQDGKNIVLIDIAQAVHVDHPKSDEFLARDMENLCRFFRKHGLKKDKNECLAFVRNQHQ